ncbi:ATP-grasp ribosomal peptide maturase [Actinoallomurus acanthiterrae]
MDFQQRMFDFGVHRADPDSPAVPCVLVLTRAADREMDALSLELAAKGVRLARIDGDRCVDVPVSVVDDGRITVAGEPFAPRLLWLRHFDLTAIPAPAGHGEYVAGQWDAFLAWAVANPGWRLVNRPARELDRLTQLDGARRIGLTVPRTVLTTEPRQSLSALGDPPGGYVLKPLGSHWLEPEPGSLRSLFPRRVSRDDLLAGGPEAGPALVQEFVESGHELRIFIVGDEVVAFRVDKRSAEDLWTDPESVRVTPIEAPDRLVAALRGLCASWGLGVAAFDLLVTEDDYVFLEVNVTGDWLWFENRAGSASVSEAVLRYVTGAFSAADPAFSKGTG